MKDFCIAFSFAATMAAAIVLLSVALWNEGCNQQVVPKPVLYTGNTKVQESKGNAIIVPSGDPNRPLIIVPSY